MWTYNICCVDGLSGYGMKKVPAYLQSFGWYYTLSRQKLMNISQNKWAS